MFFINKDILQTLVQYLNQVDIANLMLTCKHYGFNPIFKDCLNKTKQFLSKQHNVYTIGNIERFCEMFLDEITTNISLYFKYKGSSVITNNYIDLNRFIIKMLTKNVTITKNTIFIFKSNEYVFNARPIYCEKQVYLEFHTDCYSLNKIVKKKDDSGNDYYVIKHYNINPIKFTPNFTENINILNYYRINDFKNLIYNIYFKPVDDSTKVFRSYTVFEFNNKYCKNKIAYFITCKYFQKFKCNYFVHSNNFNNLFTFCISEFKNQNVNKLIPLAKID